ncbi:MAG: hypothetical protein MI810_12875 [Flavobacteriales bacterium]|nr:hypothetical protein [Flavobacteriales bacterium]
MRETYDPAIINDYLNGMADESMLMVKLMGQVIFILIAGIVLWRISAVFNKKKIKRKRSVFSESRFQNHWKRNH